MSMRGVIIVRADYRRFGRLSGGWRRVLRLLWLFIPLALTEGVSVAGDIQAGALRLPLPAGWSRAAVAPEGDPDAWQIDAPEGVKLYIWPRPTPLKVDPETFFRQLESLWAQRYGAAGTRREVLAGKEWRVQTRLGSGDENLMQWVTVHEGRAYNLLWGLPGKPAALPGNARAVLEALDWRNGDDAGGWRRLHVQRHFPGREDRDAVEALAGGALITQQRLMLEDDSIAWRLEGMMEEAKAEMKTDERHFVWMGRLRWSKSSSGSAVRAAGVETLRLIEGAPDQLEVSAWTCDAEPVGGVPAGADCPGRKLLWTVRPDADGVLRLALPEDAAAWAVLRFRARPCAGGAACGRPAMARLLDAAWVDWVYAPGPRPR